jgi:hypothetical protein
MRSILKRIQLKTERKANKLKKQYKGYTPSNTSNRPTMS